MALTEYERGNGIQSSLSVTDSSSTPQDPSGSTMRFSVIKPDGTYLIGSSTSGATASRTGTGTFEYYWNTSSTDPLGIYLEIWEGNQVSTVSDGINYGYPPIVQRRAISIVKAD